MISCIENLANEIFREIFDYLDGGDIYKAFSNLNSRFQHLINSPFPLRIKLQSEEPSKLVESCKHIIIPNRHRILSLNFTKTSVMNDFFTNCIIIDPSFLNLQSVVLTNVDVDSCLVPLIYLKSLPHLLALTIYIDGYKYNGLDRIYRIIFTFPTLKYSKVSLIRAQKDNYSNILISLPIYRNFSAIQYLIINHGCNLEELFSILNHTPQLRHLTCRNLLEARNNLRNINQIKLLNLTHIYIDIFNGCFIDFDILFQKIFAPVHILRIKEHESKHYFEAKQWENINQKIHTLFT